MKSHASSLPAYDLHNSLQVSLITLSATLWWRSLQSSISPAISCTTPPAWANMYQESKLRMDRPLASAWSTLIPTNHMMHHLGLSLMRKHRSTCRWLSEIWHSRHLGLPLQAVCPLSWMKSMMNLHSSFSIKVHQTLISRSNSDLFSVLFTNSPLFHGLFQLSVALASEDPKGPK